jgi:hypothetical protein
MIDNARPHHSWGRALSFFGFGAVAAGLVALVLAFLSSGDDSQASLDVVTVTAAATPETIPPKFVSTSPPTTLAAPPTTLPVPQLSPLAELVGEPASAIHSPRVKPISVTIDDIELWAPVRGVGVEPDGELEVPDETEVGWYELGGAPGETGATVFAAHVTWNQTVGPFYLLRDLEPGAPIDVRLDDGSVRSYSVIERTMYPKDELPEDRIWRTTGDETLVLITCGGSFNEDRNRYRDNIVVYAVPVA